MPAVRLRGGLVSIAVRVIRRFETGGPDSGEELSRVVDFPIAPAPGMAVTFAEGAASVVARVAVLLHEWAPGVYPPAVEVHMITESADQLAPARVAGWEPS